ncbi:MAG: tyrosine protein kinase, partial [Bacteroidia bacterium]|nr:tyrosine protein kinase [Bacteroidia bacterium]
MSPESPINKINLKNTVEIYSRYWKWILLSLIAALTIAYLYLRYSTYQYETKASILLKDNERDSRLSELTSLQNYGLFSETKTSILDEIKTIKSTPILMEVVEDLDLNISYYVEGKIKEQEIYSNPPVNLNFLIRDSLVQTIDTTFRIKILGPESFQFRNVSKQMKENKKLNNDAIYDFGDAISTGFGDMIITPNMGTYGSQAETNLRVEIKSYEKVVENYRSKIDVETEKNSNVITLSLKENLKDKAELILNNLIDKYNEDVIIDKEKVIQVTSEFIT